MSNNLKNKTDATKPAPQKVKPTSEIPKLRLALRRDHKVGDGYWKAGTVIAEVTLKPGVELNFLVDAVRNGLAGEVD